MGGLGYESVLGFINTGKERISGKNRGVLGFLVLGVMGQVWGGFRVG